MKSRYVEAARTLSAVPDTDRMRAFVNSVASLVPNACFAFGRYDADGEAVDLVLDDRCRDLHGRLVEWLRAESVIKEQAQGRIPRIEPMRVAVAPFRHGTSLIFGNRGRILGILLLLRSGSEPPFSREELASLEAMLDTGTSTLERLAVFDGEQSARERASARTTPAQFVLSPDYQVEFAWRPRNDNADDTLSAMLEIGDTLPPAVETAVREATASWTDDPATWCEGFSMPLPFVVVRVFPLASATGSETEYRIGVTVERFQARNALKWAARRFAMSAREVQVLALMLQGRGTTEIASALNIAESTAHDHVRRMLIKTKARNRVELAAKTLGWRTT